MAVLVIASILTISIIIIVATEIYGHQSNPYELVT